MKIELPEFTPNAEQLDWVGTEVDTARFIQAFWNAAGGRISDPRFISLVVRFGWLNKSEGWGSTRRWRNQNIADYLRVSYESDDQLAREVARAFPRLKQPGKVLKMNSGITHYYRPLRPATLDFVTIHADRIGRVFRQVYANAIKGDSGIRRAIKMLTDLGQIHVLGRAISPLNGLTPALACLDKSRRLPIMNSKTDRLLAVIGKARDADGAVELSHLIGRKGIKHSFELDVYASTADFSRIKTYRSSNSMPGDFREVGLKSELDSLAQIAASRKRIRRLHNVLTNRFREYLLWRYTIQEDQFDAVIPDWKPGRKLLIEAKTAADGPGGRTQIRQAIGQLFDYRHKFFGSQKEQVDLAILLPKEPSPDVRALLTSLDIEVIWFKGKKLEGSIEL